MVTMDRLREGVRKSLPEVSQIADADLRDKVVEAWALSLAKNGFGSIEELRPSGNPDSAPLRSGTQADHLRGVALLAHSMADALERVHGKIGVDRDLLWACALCHDVGKPFEFNPDNQKRWQNDVRASGYPALRHTLYGVYIALTVGLPEAVAHAAGAHSKEGEFVKRSLENTLVHHADHAYWRILDRAELLDGHLT